MAIDREQFARIKQAAEDLRQLHGQRDAMLDQMQNILLLRWDQQKELQTRYPHMQVTLSPEPRNAIKTAVRLMTANEPQINVPVELSRNIGAALADKIETLAATMLRASDRIRGNPIHYDGALTGLTYDEIIISVNSTADLVRYAEGGSKASLARAQRVAELTPFLFVAHDPHGCYLDYDDLGLRVFARRVLMKKAHILEKYGSDGQRAMGSMPDDPSKRRQKFEEFYVWSYWDLEYYACWIEDGGEAIHCEPHGLPFIPVVAHTVEGSRMFSRIEDQREPFLLTMQRSGLWNRQNLALSAMFTSVAAGGLWPQLVFNAPDGTMEPEIDTTTPLGYIRVFGGQLAPFQKSLIAPELSGMWQLAQQLGIESTIYKQVAGQPLGNNSTFSETALLNSAGRQPLIPVQRKLGWALGDALRMAFLWMKDGGGKYSARAGGMMAELDALSIPDGLEIEARLDVTLPQDKLAQAGVFNQLDGKVSHEWLLENILNIRQPGGMIRQTLREKAFMFMFENFLRQKQSEADAQRQAQTQAMQAGGLPQPGGLPSGGIPGGPMMGGPMMGGGPGMPMPSGPGMGGPMSGGGLPPEMMQMGMQGPEQPGGPGGMPYAPGL